VFQAGLGVEARSDFVKNVKKGYFLLDKKLSLIYEAA
jgi:hypothetical protein